MNHRFSSMTARVFVAHPYAPKSKAYELTDYRATIEKALRTAEDLTKQLINVVDFGWSRIQFAPNFESGEFTATVPELVVKSIRSSDLAIVDLTDTSPNVIYELGYLDASSIPTVLVISKRSTTQIPVDVAGRFAIEYEHLSELEAKLPALLIQCVEDMLRRSTLLAGDRDLVWFPSTVEELHLVGARSPDQLDTSEPVHRNFVYLEQFSDKDTVLELMVLLSRTYSARVHKYTSQDFPMRQLLKANLVVVGGPGVLGINAGNEICREMSRRIKSRVHYADNGESVELTAADGEGLTLRPSYSKDGRLLNDYGYFARFQNPFAPDAIVVMINGLHTAGGLGAARAFSDVPQASENFRKVRAALKGDSRHSGFETIFEVETMFGDVLVPQIEMSNVFPL